MGHACDPSTCTLEAKLEDCCVFKVNGLTVRLCLKKSKLNITETITNSPIPFFISSTDKPRASAQRHILSLFYILREGLVKLLRLGLNF